MKKKIQALACAAMLAVGGFNVWTAMDDNGRESTELKLEDIEALGYGPNEDPGMWRNAVLSWLGLQGSDWFEYKRRTYTFSNRVEVVVFDWCYDNGTYTPKCEVPSLREYSITVF